MTDIETLSPAFDVQTGFGERPVIMAAFGQLSGACVAFEQQLTNDVLCLQTRSLTAVTRTALMSMLCT